MSVEEITLGIFATCNSLRVPTYIPQIRRAAIDKNGAIAISYTTWILFLLADLSTVAYAIENRADWALAACFTANAACCLVVVAVAYRARSRLKSRKTGAWRSRVSHRSLQGPFASEPEQKARRDAHGLGGAAPMLNPGGDRAIRPAA
jgi:hypothetical protein